MQPAKRPTPGLEGLASLLGRKRDISQKHKLTNEAPDRILTHEAVTLAREEMLPPGNPIRHEPNRVLRHTAAAGFDQVVAQHIGRDTQLTSLELGLESVDILGACVSGYHCAYNNTLAWRNAKTPLPTENTPRAVFERLFGASDGTDRESRQRSVRRDRSVVDAVLGKVKALSQDIGASDREHLGQYVDSVRDVERRIQRSEQQSEMEVPEVAVPAGIPQSFEAHAKIMFDLQAIAWQVDMTRVGTFLMGREVSNRSFPEIDVPMSHHSLSHHQGDPERLAKLAKVNTLHMQMFSHFVERLKNTPDGDGSLLDHSLLLYGAGMSESNGHVYDNVPTLLVGGKLFGMTGGRQVTYKDTPPFTNLQLTVIERMGVPMEQFGNSSGKLPLLSGV